MRASHKGPWWPRVSTGRLTQADFGAGANVDSILSLANSDELWQLVSCIAMDAGWAGIPVNASVSGSNARAPSFRNWFHETGSEAIDALCRTGRGV
jgi:hypothetical protein